MRFILCAFGEARDEVHLEGGGGAQKIIGKKKKKKEEEEEEEEEKNDDRDQEHSKIFVSPSIFLNTQALYFLLLLPPTDFSLTPKIESVAPPPSHSPAAPTLPPCTTPTD